MGNPIQVGVWGTPDRHVRTAASGTHGYSENWLRGVYGEPHTELGRIMAGWLCVGGRARGEGGTKLLRELVSKAQKKEEIEPKPYPLCRYIFISAM